MIDRFRAWLRALLESWRCPRCGAPAGMDTESCYYGLDP